LSCILFLFSRTLAARILHETSSTITYELPSSISQSPLKIPASFTFQKLNEKSNVQGILIEHIQGIYGQPALFLVIREIISRKEKGLISPEEFEEWKVTLSIDVRESVSKAAVMLNAMRLTHKTHRLTNSQVCSLLEKIRGSRGLVEFALYLQSLSEMKLKNLALAALEAPLEVTEMAVTMKQEAKGGRKSKNVLASRKAPATMRKKGPTPRKVRKKAKDKAAELKGSSASELGDTSVKTLKNDESTHTSQVGSFDRDFVEIGIITPLPARFISLFGDSHYKFVRINSTTQEDVLIQEYDHGLLGQKSLGLFISSNSIQKPFSMF
jgi:hypothetical protein